MFSHQQNKQRLSLPLLSEKAVLNAAFNNIFKPLGQLLLKLIIPSGGPKITKISRNGQTRWEVYDPHTEKTILFDSENDVRIWLDEQRYRQ